MVPRGAWPGWEESQTPFQLPQFQVVTLGPWIGAVKRGSAWRARRHMFLWGQAPPCCLNPTRCSCSAATPRE